MKPIYTILAIITLITCIDRVYAQVDINGDLEKINKVTRLPFGWNHSPSITETYNITLDSIEKQQGKYAVAINSKGAGGDYATIGFNIPKTFKGKEIELRGYLKTENVESAAGLWLTIDGTKAIDNMLNRNIRGNTDWTEYSIKLPYDDERATMIVAGAILQGKGKIWFDNVRLFIDGNPIEGAKTKTITLAKAETDTAFINGSGIQNISLDPQRIKNITILGEVWGFVKYHHFDVAKGNINMDAELFRVLPDVLQAKDNTTLSNVLERWVDKLGVPPPCSTCKPYVYKDVKLTPDYANIFDGSVLTPRFTAKLTDVLNKRSTANYYVSLAPGVGNPIFNHEQSYVKTFPDMGYRLLALFRYWNMIQYFYPNRHLIGDWNSVLAEFVPAFINSSNKQSYLETVIKLIALIHDTHGFTPVLSGSYAAPFQAKFIEDQLVITAYTKDSLVIKNAVKKGDVIKAINGVAVEQLIKKYLPLTSASNYPTQLRDMPMNYLLRSETDKFTFSILRDGKLLQSDVNAIKYNANVFRATDEPEPSAPGYHLLNKDIGYVYPARYKNKDLPAIKKLFAETKGIIVDMRCYPSDFMPFTFGEYIKHGEAPFVKFTSGSIAAPGYFSTGQPLGIKSGSGAYKGKVVVIVNEKTQSQAEYTTMAFQSSPNVTVIGNTTAGADGNISIIVLPGGIQTAISGIGVLYPDGTESQRVGVKVDKQVKPTIAGIKAGKDELLEYAVKMIEEGK